MTIKGIVQAITPPIIYNCIRPFTRRETNFRSPLFDYTKRHENIIIMGNGPSLITSLSKYHQLLNTFDIIAVNQYASSIEYEHYRPNVYVLADPAYFQPQEILKKQILKLIDDIRDKTTWDLSFITPDYASNSHLIKTIKQNTHISFFPYSTVNKKNSKDSLFEAWDKNHIAPPLNNVLTTALYIAICFGYKECYLVGAESDYVEKLCVDQKTNVLYTKQKHFYNTTLGLEQNQQERVPVGSSLSKELYSLYKTFSDYELLHNYAEYKGVKVYNASEYSCIDAFDRGPIQ